MQMISGNSFWEAFSKSCTPAMQMPKSNIIAVCVNILFRRWTGMKGEEMHELNWKAFWVMTMLLNNICSVPASTWHSDRYRKILTSNLSGTIFFFFFKIMSPFSSDHHSTMLLAAKGQILGLYTIRLRKLKGQLRSWEKIVFNAVYNLFWTVALMVSKSNYFLVLHGHNPIFGDTFSWALTLHGGYVWALMK